MPAPLVRRFGALAVAVLLVAGLLPAAASPVRAAGGGSGSISLTTLGTAYTQNFDTLASTGTANALTINGWFLDESGTSTRNNGQYAAGTGSENTGDTYSFGGAGNTERAFGALLSGTLTPRIGAHFVNNTGGTITSLAISYTGEMWRAGFANRNAADRLDFQLSTSATSLASGTWIDYDSLDFSSPNTDAALGQLDGNVANNRAGLSSSISGLNIATGASFWIRWTDFNIADSDDGLAVDDFSITPAGTVDPGTTLSINDVAANEGNAGTTSFDFTVSLSAPAGAGGVTFDIAAADNTATVADNDYVANSLTGQTIPAGSSSYAFSVLVNGDTTFESDETFFVNVTNVTGATVGDGQGQGTIQNDDVATTPIHAIQGSGATSTAGTFTIEAIVVGDYQTQGSGQLRGFFVQEEDADVDADPATSEGIFVFCTTCPVPVSVGDKVRVTGASSEFFGMSQLSATTAGSTTVVSSGNPLPTAASVELPVPGVPSGDLAAATAAINAYFEALEGMLVTFPDTLAVSEYFELARYGQLILTEGGRPHQFTALNTPSAAGLIDHEIDLARRTVILDDTDNRQNRPVDSPNTAYYHPVPGLSTGNYVRGGDTITDLTGVLHWSFAGQSGTDAWRIRPVTEAYSYAFTPVNTRPTLPGVGGSLTVASFNVLNYFLTIDTTASNNVGTCSPSGTADCRGADSSQELERQRTKLLAALSAIDADVFGFMEMENTPGVEPLADLVAGLPGYAYVDTGAIGTDAIRVGIIYKSSTVAPVGNFAILDSTVDARFDSSRNRPALAQTFAENATGARFTVVVNHLKSKGSGCGVGDDDTTTGQGNCNGTRTLAAQALADWLATDPTGSGATDTLIIGDLNSYAKEDPIVALENAGYENLVDAFGGAEAYGYVFDGQLGYLDHALANASLTPKVTGVAEWHINADEIPLFDYNDDVRDVGEAAFEEESDAFPLYETNAFRTSDHDPIVVGLDFTVPTTTTLAIDPSPQQYSDTVTLTATISPSDATGSVQFSQSSNGGTWTPLGGPVAVVDGEASLADVQVLDAAGTGVRFGAAFDGTGVYTDSDADPEAALTVTKEDAAVLYDAGNLVAAQVNGPGSGSWTGPLTLAIRVKERTPDEAGTGTALPGVIANAGLRVKLVPLGPGDPIVLDDDDCVVGSVTGTGYDAVKPFTCTSPGPIPLGTYEVVVDVTGDYYTGSYADAFTVYDPSLGFATGGGTFVLDDDRVSFGFTTKYNKKGTNIQGQLIAVRHHGDGTSSRLKSNALSGLAILDAGGCGIATFAGKATYTTWDPTADGGLGAYVTTGNNTFSARADDCNNPGTGTDKIRLVGPGAFAMTGLAELRGGNISVPHTIGKK